MSHIFISYSHKDKAYAHKLQRSLMEQGFDAWIDDRIDYGVRWPHEIENRLRECDAFILIMSPNSLESDWVQNELNFARELKKMVFPLLLRGDAWWHVGTMQYVDVRKSQIPPAKFFDRLAKFSPRHPASKPPKEKLNLAWKFVPVFRAFTEFFTQYGKKIFIPSVSIILLIVLGRFVYTQLIAPPLLFFCVSDSDTHICEYTNTRDDTKVVSALDDAINWSPVRNLFGDIYFTSNRDGKAEIYRLKRNGDIERVTNTPGSSKSWSPAVGFGRDVYFTSNRENGKSEIYRLTRNGVERVTNTPEKYSSWSPVIGFDGIVYFTSNRESGKVEIYRLTQKGVERVTNTPEKYSSWSPAVGLGTDVYFTSNRKDGESEIYRLTSEGIERVTFTSEGGNWSPVIRGRNIYFTSNRSGRKEVYVLKSQVLSISDLESWTNVTENIPHYR